jgi:hypothetical protein
MKEKNQISNVLEKEWVAKNELVRSVSYRHFDFVLEK